MREAIERGVFPGAVVLVAKGGRIVFAAAFGSRSLLRHRQPMELDNVFDLASLTKPLATTTAIMLLVQQKRLSLDEPITRYLPCLEEGDKQAITLRQVLAHCSGLPAWRPYYQDVLEMEEREKKEFVATLAARNYVYDRVRNEGLDSVPGTRGIYSDLGFILLGEIVETVSGQRLDHFCQEVIFAPIKLQSTFFVALNDQQKKSQKFVPTQRCPWRGRVLCGEVDDDNAYVMEGVAGHAGLFSCVKDIHHFLLYLRDCYRGSGSFLDAAIVREFLCRDRAVEGWTYALGWDTPSAHNSSSGKYFSPSSVGHLGFTGTSVWWDLERDCYIVLLTNRIHPTRENDKIRAFRPFIHDLIMERLAQ
ncbi:MAG: serine hydrolase domain-containing protein [Candidatus Binatia bacterium]